MGRVRLTQDAPEAFTTIYALFSTRIVPIRRETWACVHVMDLSGLWRLTDFVLDSEILLLSQLTSPQGNAWIVSVLTRYEDLVCF